MKRLRLIHHKWAGGLETLEFTTPQTKKKLLNSDAVKGVELTSFFPDDFCPTLDVLFTYRKKDERPKT